MSARFTVRARGERTAVAVALILVDHELEPVFVPVAESDALAVAVSCEAINNARVTCV